MFCVNWDRWERARVISKQKPMKISSKQSKKFKKRQIGYQNSRQSSGNSSNLVFFREMKTNVNFSAARLSEISQNVRNFILIADRNFRNFGHEILPKNARNFIFGQKAPENVRILAKIEFF